MTEELLKGAYMSVESLLTKQSIQAIILFLFPVLSTTIPTNNFTKATMKKITAPIINLLINVF